MIPYFPSLFIISYPLILKQSIILMYPPDLHCSRFGCVVLIFTVLFPSDPLRLIKLSNYALHVVKASVDPHLSLPLTVPLLRE